MTENTLSFTICFVLFQRQTNDKNVPGVMTLKSVRLGFIYLTNPKASSSYKKTGANPGSQ